MFEENNRRWWNDFVQPRRKRGGSMPELKLAVTFLVPSFRVHLNSALVPFIGQLKFPIYQKMKEKGNGYL